MNFAIRPFLTVLTVTLISSGYSCIDEIRIANGDAPLNTEWSKDHFITKNFGYLDNQCGNLDYGKGGEE